MSSHLSPTNVATFYHNQCDLYLHKSYHRPPSSSPRAQAVSPLAAAHYKRGLQWEAYLFRELQRRKQFIPLRKTHLYKPKEIRDALLDAAAQLRPRTSDEEEEDVRYIAYLSFQSPDFAREFAQHGSPPRSVAFGVAKPDLVKVSLGDQKDTIVWEIIDAKSSTAVKSSHNAQTGFYHLCLRSMFEDLPHLSGKKLVPSDKVSIWLPSRETDEAGIEDRVSLPSSMPTSLLLQPLSTFLFKKLPVILSKPRDQVEWYLNPSCQGCEFLDACRDKTRQEKRLGMIPNLSGSDARLLREVMDIVQRQNPDWNAVTDIEALDSLIKSPDMMRKLEVAYAPTTKKFKRIAGVHRFSGRGPELFSPLIDAALTQKPQLTRRRVFSFPRNEDVAIFISVIIDISKDPNASDGNIGAFCVSVVRLSTADHGTGRRKSAGAPMVMAHVTGHPKEFIRLVASLLVDIGKTPGARTQVYTYSLAERNAIVNHLIHAALSSPPYIPGESLATEGTSQGSFEESPGDIRLVLGALCDGAALLVTAYQPQLLSGVLLSFLSKKNTLSKAHLETCCRRLGLSGEGTTEVLRKRLEQEQWRLAEIGGRGIGAGVARREVGQLSKIVVLKKEVERLIALPVEGFIDLPSTAQVLLDPSDRRKSSIGQCEPDDVIFGAWMARGKKRFPGISGDEKPVIKWEDALKTRNRVMRAVLDNVRKRISDAGLSEQILLNEAKPIESGMLDLCESDKLRRLMYMTQFEVVLRLQELWQERLDGCPNAPILRYVRAEKRGTLWLQIFDVVSGVLEAPVEERPFYDWLLVPDDAGDGVPPEVHFDDLSLCSVVVRPNKFVRSRWDEQQPVVKQSITISNIVDVRMEKTPTEDGRSHKLCSQAVLETYYTGNHLTKGALYRISPRLVNFNFEKILLNLITMDFQHTVANNPVPFIDLIDNPEAFAQSPTFCGELEERKEKEIVRGLNELAKLGVEHASSLILKASQHRAAKRMMMKRLSVVWGPPGECTGKTYTLALSTLRILEVLGRRAPDQCPVILVTAMTHAAIEAIVGKIESLIGKYLAIKDRDSLWLNSVDLQRVRQGKTHPHPVLDNNKVYIFAGTTYQLYRFCEKAKLRANVVIIDEAGQLPLETAALVIRWLSSTGKLILAGDHEQLAPIFIGTYPEPEDLPLFGSVLDLLMGGRKRTGLAIAATEDESQHLYDAPVVQLLENFRLNEDLGTFVQIIYAKKFIPQKSQDDLGDLRLWLESNKSTNRIMEDARLFLLGLTEAMSNKKSHSFKLMRPQLPTSSGLEKQAQSQAVSLALIRVRVTKGSLSPYEEHVSAEAKLVAALVHWLREAFPEDSIFVACPHRIQRSAARQAILSPQEIETAERVAGDENVDNLAAELAAFHLSENGLRIDTVERLQGSEASFVIFPLSHTHQPSLSSHLGFLLSRRRLNVGISRAKNLCIVISSNQVLQPSLEVLTSEETRKGLEFLRAYEARSWSGDISLEI
ncbi:hypothetical protein PIIN_01659 [Serendipita indica DSM 11827]|uniref:DNA2/NAM7 helicase-like C-terminal domain-containing protein n=1 Tax=Serendipita indica (strain DSM 11827) TaxID=1109443 RepID=G4T945_SERID|nr:hypothetical protein PIIN_01659 [Serendipita indica DSM 11827]